MKQTLLGMPLESYRKQYRTEIFVCGGLVCATLLLNIVLCVLRTDRSHVWFLLTNILTDTACGWYVIYRVNTKILMMRRMLSLVNKPKQRICGTIDSILTESRRIPHLDCVVVSVEGRKFYLPRDGEIDLEEGTEYLLSIVDNVIVEVEQ